MVYDVVAHEMCHNALFLKLVDRNLHHRQMRDGVCLKATISYINDYFEINSSLKPHQDSCRRKLEMNSLNKGVEEDTEEIAKTKKK